jgi:phosphohistidine phosphatase
MNLFLLRHAKAVEIGTDGIRHDKERPLAPDGLKKMRLIANGLRRLEPEFNLVLSSPYVRARQTAEIVVETLGLKPQIEFHPQLAVEGDLQELITDISRRHAAQDNILLVGHEPRMSQLMSYLLTGGIHLTVDFKKAALAKLCIERLRWGRCAILDWFLTPKQLALFGSLRD